MIPPVNDYRRPESVRKPNRTILIVTNGERTEVDYFEGFKNEVRLPGITIISANHSNPQNVYGYAQGKETEYDEVWCVLDVDQFGEEVKTVIDKAKASRIRCAVSNPCFEAWLLMHFQYSTASLTPQEAVKKLKQVLPSYDKSRLQFTDFFARIDTAIQNAQKLERHHQENRVNFPCDSNPYTSVHILMEMLKKENTQI